MKLFAIGKHHKGVTQLVIVRQSPTPKKPLRLLKRRQRRLWFRHRGQFLGR